MKTVMEQMLEKIKERNLDKSFRILIVGERRGGMSSMALRMCYEINKQFGKTKIKTVAYSPEWLIEKLKEARK